MFLTSSRFTFQGLPVGSLRFFFDGRRIDDEETPSSVSSVIVIAVIKAISEQ